MAPDFSMALCLRPQEAFAARMKITMFTWWTKKKVLLSFTHFVSLQTQRYSKNFPLVPRSLPARRLRWVRRSSRWACRGRRASRSPGFRSREGRGRPPDLCATQRRCIRLRLVAWVVESPKSSFISMFRSRRSSEVTNWHLIFPSEHPGPTPRDVPTGITPLWCCL